MRLIVSSFVFCCYRYCCCSCCYLFICLSFRRRLKSCCDRRKLTVRRALDDYTYASDMPCKWRKSLRMVDFTPKAFAIALLHRYAYKCICCSMTFYDCNFRLSTSARSWVCSSDKKWKFRKHTQAGYKRKRVRGERANTQQPQHVYTIPLLQLNARVNKYKRSFNAFDFIFEIGFSIWILLHLMVSLMPLRNCRRRELTDALTHLNSPFLSLTLFLSGRLFAACSLYSLFRSRNTIIYVVIVTREIKYAIKIKFYGRFGRVRKYINPD